MVKFIDEPAEIAGAGTKNKLIQEFIGRVNTGTEQISIARMFSPQGWQEPGQTPRFDEYTIVLKGMLRVETRDRIVNVGAGQAVIAYKDEWVRYSTPYEGGAEYLAVCIPAFSLEKVNREQ